MPHASLAPSNENDSPLLLPRRAQVLTVPEVAVILRCSKAHVHNLIAGKVEGASPLPSLTLGRRRLVLAATLGKWMQSNQHGV